MTLNCNEVIILWESLGIFLNKFVEVLGSLLNGRSRVAAEQAPGSFYPFPLLGHGAGILQSALLAFSLAIVPTNPQALPNVFLMLPTNNSLLFYGKVKGVITNLSMINHRATT